MGVDTLIHLPTVSPEPTESCNGSAPPQFFFSVNQVETKVTQTERKATH